MTDKYIQQALKKNALFPSRSVSLFVSPCSVPYFSCSVPFCPVPSVSACLIQGILG